MRCFRAAPAAMLGLQCGRLLARLLCVCVVIFGVSRTWRMLQSRLLLPAVRYFFGPFLSPPLCCLSHTQKVVKMQIKLKTNWAGRQLRHTHIHKQCSFCVSVYVSVLFCVGRLSHCAGVGFLFRLVQWISCFANDMNSLDNDC